VTGDLPAELSHDGLSAELLAANERCVWMRSKWGIVGTINLLDLPQDGTTLSVAIAAAVSHAYSLLDALPETRLPAGDLWNLTLLLSVPWTRADGAKRPAIHEPLRLLVQDTKGARKVILWSDETVKDHFGRLTTPRQVLSTPFTDPLRDTIAILARDTAEREALDLLFKRKLTQEDIDELVRVLGREHA
jgi:hypothetical protein